MQVTEITASWGETVNLGDYSNARPELTMRATIHEDEDPIAAQRELLETCRITVQEQADRALELHGKPAKYSTDPRYAVVYASLYLRGRHWRSVYALVPGLAVRGLKEYRVTTLAAGHRIWAARRLLEQEVAERERNEAQVFDCANGDLSHLIAALVELRQAEQEAEAAEQTKMERERAEREAAWEAERSRRAAQQQPAAAADDEDDEDDE